MCGEDDECVLIGCISWYFDDVLRSNGTLLYD